MKHAVWGAFLQACALRRGCTVNARWMAMHTEREMFWFFFGQYPVRKGWDSTLILPQPLPSPYRLHCILTGCELLALMQRHAPLPASLAVWCEGNAAELWFELIYCYIKGRATLLFPSLSLLLQKHQPKAAGTPPHWPLYNMGFCRVLM